MYKNEQNGRAVGSIFRVVWPQPQVEHRGVYCGWVCAKHA